MRAIVTGQVGMDKKEYLDAVAALGRQRGESIEVFHVGDMMYAEAPDVRPGRILDLPLSRLHALRRSVFKDIIIQSAGRRNVIVNTHATFRWRHGLFAAFDFDQILALKPDMFICLVDNIEVVHHRLHREHQIDATMKDCMVWREEEILATELMAQATGFRRQGSGVGGQGPSPGTPVPGTSEREHGLPARAPFDPFVSHGLEAHAPIPGFYILSRGRHAETIETGLRLVTRPEMRKVYPSFPMSHVVDLPDVLDEINRFRAQLAEHFITFDPGDVDEKLLLERAIVAAREGRDFVEVDYQESDSATSRIPTPLAPGSAGGSAGAHNALREPESSSSPAHPPAEPGGEDLATPSSVPQSPSAIRHPPGDPSRPSPRLGPPSAIRVPVRQILDIAGDVDGQIYMRDFKLIDQSDMIVSLIPELPGGMPALSSGVERELQHAFEHTKEVYVIWKPKRSPSPFITETATAIFPSVEEALKHFDQRGMFRTRDLFGD